MTGVPGGKLSVRGYYIDHGKDLQMGQTFEGIYLALKSKILLVRIHFSAHRPSMGQLLRS